MNRDEEAGAVGRQRVQLPSACASWRSDLTEGISGFGGLASMESERIAACLVQAWT
jgi:hypothetical protein